MKDLYGRRLFRTSDGNYVPFWAWLKAQWRYSKASPCPRGGRHISEIAHGGEFCIKCGKVGSVEELEK